MIEKYKLYNGDCREIIPNLEFHAIITDQPYEIDWFIDVLNDLWKRDYYGNTVIFCSPENQLPEPDELAYWIKPLSTKNFSKHIGRFVEMICIYRGYYAPFNCLHWSQMTGVYHDLIDEPITIHPYKKPLSLMERLIKIYTDPGDIVLDCFMGSGTTGIACANTGRKFIGIEQDANYFQYAKSQIESAYDRRL